MSSVEDVILGRAGGPGDRPAQTFVEGRIQKVTAAGAIFTVPSWDGGRHAFGPAPWPMSRVEPTGLPSAGYTPHTHGGPHDHPETVPPPGARCLVVFLGSGVDRPWILGWWPS